MTNVSKITVCSSTILVNFAAIDRLDVLQAAFEHLLIPNVVYAETIGSNFPDWQRLAKEVSNGWLEVHSLPPSTAEHEMPEALDEGDLESILLALELQIPRILLDEQDARQVAGTYNLRVLGTLGTLLLAKEKQIIPKVQPLLDNLLDQAHYWIKADLYQQVLQQAREAA